MVPLLQKSFYGKLLAPAETTTAAIGMFPKLLPHEWLCSLFFMSMWIRLVPLAGFFARDTLIFLFLIIAGAAAVKFCATCEHRFRWRMRLAFYPLAMNSVYFVLATAIPAIHPQLEDDALQAVDRWLIGTNLSLRLEGWIHPVATEVLSGCYLWYLVYLFSTQALYLFADLNVVKKQYSGLFSIYGIGFIGYSLVPALGPFCAMANQFHVPLEGLWATQITAYLSIHAGNRVDVFPSLHVANSLYILLFDYRYMRRRFWRYLVPFLGLVISTIYLRYHYTVDVLCGIVISLTVLWLTNQPQRRKEGAHGG